MTVDPSTPEGLVARFAHAWRVFRNAPLVSQPLHSAVLDDLVAAHEAAGGDADADFAVVVTAAQTKAAIEADAADKVEAARREALGEDGRQAEDDAKTADAEASQAVSAVADPPEEPFGHVVDPAAPPPPPMPLVEPPV